MEGRDNRWKKGYSAPIVDNAAYDLTIREHAQRENYKTDLV